MERRIAALLEEAIARCRSAGTLAFEGELGVIEVSAPKVAAHGDLATNVALALAARARQKPRAVAEAIVAELPREGGEIAEVIVAGPGFINFRIEPVYYLRALAEIDRAGANYGRSETHAGKRVQVEFVSANPTGPLHIGHGRGAVYGDVLGNVFAAIGYEVTKEYYVNDAGNQIRTLGRSVWLRLQELEGHSVAFPQECYQGHYIVDIARALLDEEGDRLRALDEEAGIAFCGERASAQILGEIKADLAETGIVHDVYFCETRLHEEEAIERCLDWLCDHGHLYEKEGALWFRSTAFGDDKDRVLRKSDGALTYFASDIAYHKEKFDRGFDRVIDIWGADHAGYVARMKAAVAALEHDPQSFDAVLIQLVNLVREGEAVSMSTRAATYETLADVRRDVGRDVCRYFFLMRSHNAQLDFDLNLARSQTPDNPVFYIQYAHARIASVFRKGTEVGHVAAAPESVDFEHLELPEERRLARMLLGFPTVVEECAATLEPHKIAFYLLELARQFQSYYSKGRADERYRMLSDDPVRTAAKLYLLKNVQSVLQNALRMLGISAPKAMARQEDEDV